MDNLLLLAAIAEKLASHSLSKAELEEVRRQLDPEAAGRRFEHDPGFWQQWSEVNEQLAARVGLDADEMPGRAPWDPDDAVDTDDEA